ncbi:phospholipase D-like domain-containing protein [Bradyrhizobium huanghuaihaiense]|uniref:phospholipase D-like domain-containing protein n=1 Tax=Bradyrhizobium huanghuaihaiense TaxID=990078 RepID=UPI0021A9FA80|nr:phospholipase D-like domain-containing protein [Bradyrhizobium sp. CB3035]UWU76210.1 phospholipase D-like domain-containing protein [Bradyrhizobium sp. CB3035]
MTDSLIAPSAKARFVVTLPPEPSRVGEQLQKLAGASFTTLTDTKDAFLHLARRARQRLAIITPYIDSAGAGWAADLFEATQAANKTLVLRGTTQIDACGPQGERLRRSASQIFDYSLASNFANGQSYTETFHAKIVLADGAAAYVGSANFLYRSREMNLECGFLIEGNAVAPVAVLVEALLNVFSRQSAL